MCRTPAAEQNVRIRRIGAAKAAGGGAEIPRRHLAWPARERGCKRPPPVQAAVPRTPDVGRLVTASEPGK